MTGTSPVANSVAHLSASHQSSSYLPRHESSFMRDFSCCGTVHPSPHDLLRHREECHPNQPADARNPSFSFGMSQHGLNQAFTSNPSIPLSAAQQASMRPQGHGESARRTQALETIMDDDALDMEMDDVPSFNPPTTTASQSQSESILQAISGPHLGNFGLMGNPTVSSVNTPTLSTQQVANASQSPNPAYADMNNFGNLNMYGNDFTMFDQSGFSQDLTGLTIHDPASQLSANMSQNVPMDSSIITALQQQQLGVPAALLAFPPQEDKKYKCPVVGCEKAYKNQNGLKYHKQVSPHQVKRI
jgi:transcription factor SFP1